MMQSLEKKYIKARDKLRNNNKNIIFLNVKFMYLKLFKYALLIIHHNIGFKNYNFYKINELGTNLFIMKASLSRVK